MNDSFQDDQNAANMHEREYNQQENSTSIIKEETDSINNINEEIMPPPSPWHFVISPFIPIWRFDEQSILRINLTREKLSPYYFCHIILITSYIYYYKVLSKYIYQNDTKYQNIIYYSLTFFCIMTGISYIVTHFSNPGILPYNWSTTKQRFYTKNELRDGFAINYDQKRWGKSHDWPPRSFFSGDYGAIVLRADHYCFWISHWIGIKNHKFFIQSLFYGSSYSIEFLYIMHKVYKNSEASQFNRKYFFGIIFFVFIVLSWFQIINLFNSLFKVSFNSTTCEKLLDYDNTFYDKGIIKNFEEIFGSIFLFPLWFLPITIPLPVDGFNYTSRPNDICFAKNRSQQYIALKQ